MTLDTIIRQTVEEAVTRAVAPLQAEVARLREQLAGRSQASDEALLSTAQAAALLGVRPATIRAWIGEGRLRPHGTGRALRVSRRELLALRPDASGAEVVDLEDRARAILQRGDRRR